MITFFTTIILCFIIRIDDHIGYRLGHDFEELLTKKGAYIKIFVLLINSGWRVCGRGMGRQDVQSVQERHKRRGKTSG